MSVLSCIVFLSSARLWIALKALSRCACVNSGVGIKSVLRKFHGQQWLRQPLCTRLTSILGPLHKIGRARLADSGNVWALRLLAAASKALGWNVCSFSRGAALSHLVLLALRPHPQWGNGRRNKQFSGGTLFFALGDAWKNDSAQWDRMRDMEFVRSTRLEVTLHPWGITNIKIMG